MRYLVQVVRIVELRREPIRGQAWVPNKKAGQNYNCDTLDQAIQTFNKLKKEPNTTSVAIFVQLETWVRS